jgi:hypothetical protein
MRRRCQFFASIYSLVMAEELQMYGLICQVFIVKFARVAAKEVRLN